MLIVVSVRGSRGTWRGCSAFSQPRFASCRQRGPEPQVHVSEREPPGRIGAKRRFTLGLTPTLDLDVESIGFPFKRPLYKGSLMRAAFRSMVIPRANLHTAHRKTTALNPLKETPDLPNNTGIG